MNGLRILPSRRLQLVAAVTYAFAGLAAFLWLVPRSAATMPGLLILLGLPLAFRLVPRNYVYGRSFRTLWTTEETWYRQNVITGVVMTGVGTVWLATLGVRWLIE